MSTIVTLTVKTIAEKTRAIVLLAPEGCSDRFVPGTTVPSYRFEKVFKGKRDILGKNLSDSGAIAKLVVRIHSSQVWFERVDSMTKVEYDAALAVEKSCFAINDVFSLSLEDAAKIETELQTRKEVDWSRISANAKRMFEVSTKSLVVQLANEMEENVAKVVNKTEQSSSTRNDNYFYIAPQAASAYYSVGMMLKSGSTRIGKILMIGPSGWGKTSLPKHFAKINGLEVLRMDCAKVRDPEEWFGFRGALNGTTTFTKSDFVTSIEKGNVVIILDEINRIEPFIANTLFPILHDSGEITINNELIRAGSNVLVVGTINVGFEYTGTFTMDAALANRFDVICPASKIPTGEEIKVLANREGIPVEVASKIIDVAEKVRALKVVDCSMRTTLSIAKIVCAISSGRVLDSTTMDSFIRTAFQHVVIDRANLNPGTEIRLLIDAVNSQVGALSEKKVSLKIF